MQKHKLSHTFQILLKKEADSVVESNKCRTLWGVLNAVYCYEIPVKYPGNFLLDTCSEKLEVK